jgi:hypothetical protein
MTLLKICFFIYLFIYIVKSNKLVYVITLLTYFLVEGGHWMSKVECTVTPAADS